MIDFVKFEKFHKHADAHGLFAGYFTLGDIAAAARPLQAQLQQLAMHMVMP